MPYIKAPPFLPPGGMRFPSAPPVMPPMPGNMPKPPAASGQPGGFPGAAAGGFPGAAAGGFPGAVPGGFPLVATAIPATGLPLGLVAGYGVQPGAQPGVPYWNLGAAPASPAT